MKIYTSYFAKYKQLIGDKICPVSIARFPPKFIAESGCLSWPAVAPSPDVLQKIKSSDGTDEDRREYTEAYINETLAPFAGDPEVLLRRLREIVPAGTEAVALLCFEKPGDFCHRHILAGWLNDHIPGLDITEYDFDKNDNLSDPLF